MHKGNRLQLLDEEDEIEFIESDDPQKDDSVVELFDDDNDDDDDDGGNTSELAMTIAKLPVFYKQRDLFFPAWSYALPTWIIKIPVTFLEVGMWGFLTYYVIGFDPNVGRFAKQYLILLLINQMASAIFRMLGALGRTMILANTFGDVAYYWIWGYYGSPMMYGMNAIAVNEFLGHQWSKTIGVEVLKSRGFFPYSYWYWIGSGALVGFILILNFGYTLALTHLNHTEMKEQGIVENRLLLLKGVSGAFRSGVLTALVGVSGAGKTTLMDVLAGRKTSGYIEGDITISGYPKNQKTFARIAGYCEQTDIHSPHVTVYESLLFSAWLRLPSEVDTDKRKMFVNEVLELVELDTLKEALVGFPGVNGLSIEQRKRLTIAVELVSQGWEKYRKYRNTQNIVPKLSKLSKFSVYRYFRYGMIPLPIFSVW
ncbi:hypothetical protein OROMI_025217 [Orobanche minor]